MGGNVHESSDPWERKIVRENVAKLYGFDLG